MEKFAAAAKTAGLDGALVTDITVEESTAYRKLMHSHDLATIFSCGANQHGCAPEENCSGVSRFIYAVSRTGSDRHKTAK